LDILSSVSWFPEKISEPIQDIHIVRVVATNIEFKRPKIRNDALFGRPERWTGFPLDEGRDRTEKSETERLCKDPPKGEGRRLSQEAAQRAYRGYFNCWKKRNREANPKMQPAHQDVRWTAQRLDEQRDRNPRNWKCNRPPDFFDELLYRLYATNLDIFGDKVARDLYIFDITPTEPNDGMAQKPYLLDFHFDGRPGQISGQVRLRLYAVMRQLAYPPAFNPENTWFSSSIMVASVLSPIPTVEQTTGGNTVAANKLRKRSIEDVIRLSLGLEQAHVTKRAHPSERVQPAEPLLDDFILCKAIERLGILDSKVQWSRLNRSMLTKFSAFIMDIDASIAPQWILSHPPGCADTQNVDTQRADKFSTQVPWFWCSSTEFADALDIHKLCVDKFREQAPWRIRFLHYVACLCYPKFQICAKPNELWTNPAAALRCECEYSTLSLEALASDYLPGGSSSSIRDDTLSMNSPGRRVLLRSVSGRPCISDQGRDGEYNERRILGSVAWNVLLLCLVAGQEAVLERLHSDLSEPSGIAIIRDALRNFDDFYDVDLFDLPTSSAYRDAFNALQKSIGLDHQYNMLHRKLEVSVGEIHARNLVWAITALVALCAFDVIHQWWLKEAIVAGLVLALILVVFWPMRRLWAGWAEHLWCQILFLPEWIWSRVVRNKPMRLLGLIRASWVITLILSSATFLCWLFWNPHPVTVWYQLKTTATDHYAREQQCKADAKRSSDKTIVCAGKTALAMGWGAGSRVIPLPTWLVKAASLLGKL
jgi:hypothetical protein